MAGIDLGIGGLSDGERVGAGGNAVVYRAREIDHDRWVAVKVLRLADEAGLRRFDRERRAMGRLSELDGFVTIYSSGFTAAGEPYLVMPMLSGSLQDRLNESEPMGWSEAVALMAVVARTVDAAHGEQVIHRDLKPANILLTASGAPLVADFGIAKLTGSTTAAQSTALTFTPSYTPPEVLVGAEASKSGDIYGLGATLYALVAGAPPFVTQSDENVFALMHRIATEPVKDLRSRGVPEHVCAAIETAMHKDPDRRHSTAAGLATALDTIGMDMIFAEEDLQDFLATAPDEPQPGLTTPDEPQDVGDDQTGSDLSATVVSQFREPEPEPDPEPESEPEPEPEPEPETEPVLVPLATAAHPPEGSTPTTAAGPITIALSDQPEPPPSEYREEQRTPPSRPRKIVALVAVAVIIAGVAAAFVVQRRNNNPSTISDGPLVTTPQVTTVTAAPVTSPPVNTATTPPVTTSPPVTTATTTPPVTTATTPPPVTTATTPPVTTSPPVTTATTTPPVTTATTPPGAASISCGANGHIVTCNPNNGLGMVNWGDGSSSTTNLRRVYQSLGSKTITYTDPSGQIGTTIVQVSCFSPEPAIDLPSGALPHQICP